MLKHVKTIKFSLKIIMFLPPVRTGRVCVHSFCMFLYDASHIASRGG